MIMKGLVRIFPEPGMKKMKSSFLCVWTLKESYVKAIGIGVSYPMKNISFSFENGRIISNVENCVFNQTVIGGKYIVSLCRIINE